MKPQPYTLVGVDIAGDWNRPLLTNAALISGCSVVFASSRTPASTPDRASAPAAQLVEQVLSGFQRVVACETTKRSVSLYEFPAPRESTAVLVGNEEGGLPRHVLKRADAVVCIPMAGPGLSSLNVAVAAAISLYALSRDLGRSRRTQSPLRPQDSDVLIESPNDAHELGSLLRSVYVLGWRRAYVADPHRIWFTQDPRRILEGRAAARRANNALAVLPVTQLNPATYDTVLVCDPLQEGRALSKLRLPECRRLLVVLGSGESLTGVEAPVQHVTVDLADRAVPPRDRHAGSILLSVIAARLRT